ncbi:MAG TPA: PAS domain S-box protein, partial [Anaerovoracaceae bacterium]|nr:PAS domain S-box protein [Anaerovoracaceae bacterium]
HAPCKATSEAAVEPSVDCSSQVGERLLAFMKTTSDVIYSMSPDWRVMTKLHGKGFLADTVEPNGRWLDKYIPFDDRLFVSGVIDKCIKEKKVCELEHRVFQEDGSVGWTYSKAIPLLNDDGSIREWYGAARDITVRKLAEQALIESENRYRTIVETAGEGIVYSKLDGSYLYINKQLSDMLGYSEEEILGKTCLDFCFIEDSPQVYRVRNVLNKGDTLQGEFRFRRKDSSELWTSFNATPVFNAVGEHVANFAIYTDITERKKMEEALKENEKKYRVLFETVNDGFWWVDPQRVIVEVNEGMATMLGYRIDELIGRAWVEFVEKDFLVRGFQVWNERKLEEKYSFEFKMIKKDGSLIWVRANSLYIPDEKGEFTSNLTAFVDITERKMAEEKLRKNERRHVYLLKLSDKLRSLSDEQSIQDAVTCLLAEHFYPAQSNYVEYDEDYIIIRSRTQNDDTWGIGKKYKRGEALGGIDILSLDDGIVYSDISEHAEVSEGLRDLILSWNMRACITMPIFRGKRLVASITVYQSTSRIWFQNEIELVRETAERTWMAMERIRAAKVLRKSKEKLRKENENKNNFISMLSHELRNPLAVITAGISLLQQSDDKLQAGRVMEMMKRQSDQLCKLVDDLLDMTRIAQNRFQLDKENIDLRDLAINVTGDMAATFEEKGVCFTVEIEEKPIPIYADLVRITQSIGNLLHNASKFTPQGGAVLFSLRQEEDDAVIRVEDNGIGVGQELLSHLFKPFTQVDNSLYKQSSGSLGLGLSIVKGIIDMHKGSVTASSEGPGKGALFT